MHDRFISLVLEIALPATSKFRRGPILHFFQFFLIWSDFHACLDTVRGQGTSAFEIPLLKNPLLYFRVPAGEVIKRLDVRLGSVDGEGEVMVLKVATYTWQVHDWFDASTTELLRVTDPRPLEDEGSAEGAAADDYLLASFVNRAWRVPTSQGLGWDSHNTNSPPILNDDSIHLGVTLQVKVRILASSTVNVCMSRVTATA